MAFQLKSDKKKKVELTTPVLVNILFDQLTVISVAFVRINIRSNFSLKYCLEYNLCLRTSVIISDV